MAAANESQELKIAVAAFVSLTVILAVTSYFLYSNYDQTFQKLTAAEEKMRTAQKAADEATRQSEDMQKTIGTRAQEYEAVKTEIANEKKKIDEDLATIGPMVVDMVSKVQAAGERTPPSTRSRRRRQTCRPPTPTSRTRRCSPRSAA